MSKDFRGFQLVDL